jgi:hypothetical protein
MKSTRWRPDWSVLKGLWFRARYAHVEEYGRTSTSIEDHMFCEMEIVI